MLDTAVSLLSLFNAQGLILGASRICHVLLFLEFLYLSIESCLLLLIPQLLHPLLFKLQLFLHPFLLQLHLFRFLPHLALLEIPHLATQLHLSIDLPLVHLFLELGFQGVIYLHLAVLQFTGLHTYLLALFLLDEYTGGK